MTDCSECGSWVNFYSESETYEILEDIDGNLSYLCQDCLDKARELAKCET